jgi:hypothetical protein
MTKQVDYDYYDWLVSQVEVRNANTYSYVFERMHNLEFVWTVPNDDNRVQDCRDLRVEFLDGTRKKLSLEGVTLLELLIVLARSLEFTAGGRANEWAWKLLKNLRLTKVPDPVSDDEAQRIDDILDALVWRTYEPDGQGGFFPLKDAQADQTKVELWYQLNAYVIEMGAP